MGKPKNRHSGRSLESEILPLTTMAFIQSDRNGFLCNFLNADVWSCKDLLLLNCISCAFAKHAWKRCWRGARTVPCFVSALCPTFVPISACLYRSHLSPCLDPLVLAQVWQQWVESHVVEKGQWSVLHFIKGSIGEGYKRKSRPVNTISLSIFMSCSSLKRHPSCVPPAKSSYTNSCWFRFLLFECWFSIKRCQGRSSVLVWTLTTKSWKLQASTLRTEFLKEFPKANILQLNSSFQVEE